MKKFELSMVALWFVLNFSYGQNGTFTETFNSYFNDGNYNQALSVCNDYINSNPNDEEAYTFRAMVYIELHEIKKAIKDYDIVLSLNPKYGYYYYQRGYWKFYLKDVIGAMEDFSKAIVYGKDHFDYCHFIYYRAECKKALNDKYGMIQDYGLMIDYLSEIGINNYNEKAIFKFQLDALYNARAIVKFELEDLNAAILDWQMANKIKKYHSYYYNIGISQYRLGDEDLGCLNLYKALNLGSPLASELIDEYCN
ncbi:hypothetical protein [Mangrovimonas sp. ST2L15]|uniref:hypothetical protein n=1 Tax=Mangrovimonas sp. ST2L15 TaxID=1645916 RepID=UPI0006B52106|nr:hypothetical protein [Mangrovimonas sp. ST2L15]